MDRQEITSLRARRPWRAFLRGFAWSMFLLSLDCAARPKPDPSIISSLPPTTIVRRDYFAPSNQKLKCSKTAYSADRLTLYCVRGLELWRETSAAGSAEPIAPVLKVEWCDIHITALLPNADGSMVVFAKSFIPGPYSTGCKGPPELATPSGWYLYQAALNQVSFLPNISKQTPYGAQLHWHQESLVYAEKDELFEIHAAEDRVTKISKARLPYISNFQYYPKTPYVVYTTFPQSTAAAARTYGYTPEDGKNYLALGNLETGSYVALSEKVEDCCAIQNLSISPGNKFIFYSHAISSDWKKGPPIYSKVDFRLYSTKDKTTKKINLPFEVGPYRPFLALDWISDDEFYFTFQKKRFMFNVGSERIFPLE